MAMEDEQGMLTGLWHWPPRWEEESQQSVRDLTLVPILALMFFVVRYLLDRVIFEVSKRGSSLEFFLLSGFRPSSGDELCESLGVH